MRINYILVTLTALYLNSYIAQSNTVKVPSSDTSRITFGKNKIIIISNKEDENWEEDTPLDSLNRENIDKKKYPHDNNDEWGMVGMFHFGANGYLYNNQTSFPSQYRPMELDYSRSQTIGFDFMLRGIDLFNKRVYLSPGIGLDWNKYHFKDKQQTLSTQNDTVIFFNDSTITYDKYKLRTTYVQVPLLLGFRLGNFEKNIISIELGAVAGYNIGAITKAKYAINGTKFKDKIRDDYNINPFKLDAIARVSFGDVGLFARYSFTSLFEENKAPTVTPFALGLTLGSI